MRELVLVDVTPSALHRHAELTTEQQGTVALMQGEREFPSFQAMLDLTVAAAPHREVKALRRGVFHNSRRLDNGNWAWRYDAIRAVPDFGDLWDDVDALAAPITLVRGGTSGFVTDEDAAELAKRATNFRDSARRREFGPLRAKRPAPRADRHAATVLECSRRWRWPTVVL